MPYEIRCVGVETSAAVTAINAHGKHLLLPMVRRKFSRALTDGGGCMQWRNDVNESSCFWNVVWLGLMLIE
jgi:hypothetical protein